MGHSLTVNGMPRPRQGANSARQLPEKSVIHKIALALVALTVGSGAIVFSEPAPVDALTLMLIVGLPVIGLVSIRPPLLVILSALLVMAGAAFFASSLATDVERAVTHNAVTLYLYLAAFTFAAFVSRNPAAHMRLILNAYTVAAVIAAAAALAGYFGMVPGADELFTKFGRASGPFKDPNVFGAFLVLAVVYTLHLALSLRGGASVAAFAALGLMMFAVLLSFSRGAWAASGVGILIYGYLSFVTAKRNLDRVKLICLTGASVAAAVLLVGVAFETDGIAKLLEERASLSQDYDKGPDGRFGGQAKAEALIVENVFGIGALEFNAEYHPEDVHNVYLTMFLNAGWLGGFLYLFIAALTALFGVRHAFRRTSTQPLFIVAYAALAATLLEGLLIDSDHWRHFYLLMGLVWGLMIADRRIVREARIIIDRRPVLLNKVLIIPPSRRKARVLTPVRRALPAAARPALPRRPARIITSRR